MTMGRRKQLSYEAHKEIAIDLKLARRMIMDNYIRVGNGLPIGRPSKLAAQALHALDVWRQELEDVMCRHHPNEEWRQVYTGDPQDRKTLVALISERLSK